MITRYIQTAMHQATYELLEDGTFYGEITACKGVYACRNFRGLSRFITRGFRRLDYSRIKITTPVNYHRELRNIKNNLLSTLI